MICRSSEPAVLADLYNTLDRSEPVSERGKKKPPLMTQDSFYASLDHADRSKPMQLPPQQDSFQYSTLDRGAGLEVVSEGDYSTLARETAAPIMESPGENKTSGFASYEINDIGEAPPVVFIDPYENSNQGNAPKASLFHQQASSSSDGNLTFDEKASTPGLSELEEASSLPNDENDTADVTAEPIDSQGADLSYSNHELVNTNPSVAETAKSGHLADETATTTAESVVTGQSKHGHQYVSTDLQATPTDQSSRPYMNTDLQAIAIDQSSRPYVNTDLQAIPAEHGEGSAPPQDTLNTPTVNSTAPVVAMKKRKAQSRMANAMPPGNSAIESSNSANFLLEKRMSLRSTKNLQQPK